MILLLFHYILPIVVGCFKRKTGWSPLLLEKYAKNPNPPQNFATTYPHHHSLLLEITLFFHFPVISFEQVGQRPAYLRLLEGNDKRNNLEKQPDTVQKMWAWASTWTSTQLVFLSGILTLTTDVLIFAVLRLQALLLAQLEIPIKNIESLI